MAKRLLGRCRLGIVLLPFLFLLLGCNKDMLTYPVRIDFGIGINQQSAQQVYVSLSEAVVGVGSIGFVGLRQVGEGVYFDTQAGVEHGTYVIAAGDSAKYITFFDIPQGVYDLMSWKLTLAEIDDDIYEDELVDSDDYGLLVKGAYTSIGGQQRPIYFLVNPMEVFSCEATGAAGLLPISIVDGNSYTLLLKLNPMEAIAGINRDYFENATVSISDDGIEHIVVSSVDNTSIHQLFLFQLAKTLRATVK